MENTATDKIFNLVEKNFHPYLAQKKHHVVMDFDSLDLLVYSRIDLAFKLFYLDLIEVQPDLATLVYKEHIRALSMGSYSEPGDSNKNSIEDYLKSFNKTMLSIRENGFDSNRTLIPLSNNLSIANGAHRLASCIFYNKKVKCIVTDVDNHLYDYNFFLKRAVPRDYVELAVNKFIEYSNKTHIAFLWPVAKGHTASVRNLLSNIVYEKSIKLSINGAHNLITQIYSGEEWLGSAANGFNGAMGKVVSCFKDKSPVRMIVFTSNNLDDVNVIKDKIRELYNLGKHSIHITDNKCEALKISKLILNPNSLHFINNSRPYKYINDYNFIIKFKKYLCDNELDPNKFLLTNDIVLSLYGIRSAFQKDCLVIDKINHYKLDEVNFLESENNFFYNPDNYFWFADMKFLSFNNLLISKQKFKSSKNNKDLNKMMSYADKNFNRKIIINYKQSISYFVVRLKSLLIKILLFIGLYNKLRLIRNFLLNIKLKE